MVELKGDAEQGGGKNMYAGHCNQLAEGGLYGLEDQVSDVGDVTGGGGAAWVEHGVGT